MFTTLIVQPIFNLLVLIEAIIPGHNFGLAVIIFTIIIRLLLWPLVRKQLHHARAMRALAPELKKIKQAAAGDRRKESMLTMELYKERQINPFASLGIVIVQIPILIGLYIGLQKIIKDPHNLVSFSYPFMHHLGWIKSLQANINNFDGNLFGAVDLTRHAASSSGWYLPALIISAASAIMQYVQSKMLLPQASESKSLRNILSEAGQGKSADQSEVSAAVGRSTLLLIPILVFLVSLQLAAALPLYWLTSSLIATLQQKKILGQDVKEASQVVVTTRVEGEDAAPVKAKTKAKAKRGGKKRK